MRLIKGILSMIIGIAIFPTVKWISESEVQAPECCGERAELIGSHTSLFSEELFYQCPTCKKVFTISNSHKGVNVFHLWRAIFLSDVVGNKGGSLDGHDKESQAD